MKQVAEAAALVVHARLAGADDARPACGAAELLASLEMACEALADAVEEARMERRVLCTDVARGLEHTRKRGAWRCALAGLASRPGGSGTGAAVCGELI